MATEPRSGLAEIGNILFGIGVQLARTYLYVKTEKKAIFYLAAVTVLSIFAMYFPLPENFYFAKKGNVLNEFGVKLGWFWTLFVLVPFTYLTARAHRKSFEGIAGDLVRLLIATGCWYFCTNWFVNFERMTGRCHGSGSSPRSTCHADGGKWVPGFDISGHCFILVYSALIMCEESRAFRNLPFIYRKGSHSVRTQASLDEAFAIKIYFVLVFILHILWDFELVISVLYFHHIHHKIIGTLIAIGCWYGTYRFWYPTVGMPSPPIDVRVRQSIHQKS